MFRPIEPRAVAHRTSGPRARRGLLLFAIALLGALLLHSPADVPLPPNMLNPATPAEAWNVISMVRNNVERLIAEARLPEVPQQIALCSPALRALASAAQAPSQRAAVAQETTQLLTWVNSVAQSAKDGDREGTLNHFQALKTSLSGLARQYDPQVVNADIFICPMHPDILSAKKTDECGKCGMALVTRRIPYSFIYTKPGEPTVVLTATPSGPCEAGKKIQVKVRLSRRDGTPVLTRDLMEMHTEPIHLLIQEPTLTDYHHEHPFPSGTPGEYEFSFTPQRTGSYRIWADIVPTATGVQELPFVDLPSAVPPGPVQDKENRFTSTAGGYHFTMTLAGGDATPVRAGSTRKMHITITDANGEPTRKLEPVMNAFAHLVGFYDDYLTVVHMHPSGGDILDPEARGGPALGFQFFPPKPGFLRLYCQVLVEGKMLFAPFNLNVVP